MRHTIKAATELRPGDRIVTTRGVERVRAASTVTPHRGMVTIHTDQHDWTTTLPCPVKVTGANR